MGVHLCGDHNSRREPRADRRLWRESYVHCGVRHLLAHRNARRHAHFWRDSGDFRLFNGANVTRTEFIDCYFILKN